MNHILKTKHRILSIVKSDNPKATEVNFKNDFKLFYETMDSDFLKVDKDTIELTFS